MALTQSDRWPAGRSRLHSHSASPAYDTSAQPASTHSSEHKGHKEGEREREKEISKIGKEGAKKMGWRDQMIECGKIGERLHGW